MTLDGQRLDARRYQVVLRTLIFGVRDGEVLLQKVPPGKGAWAGLWNGIGGHVEPGESAGQAARREFREETGLDLIDLRLAGEVVVDLGSSPGIAFSVFAGTVAAGSPAPSDEGELRWYTPEQAGRAAVVEDLPTLLPRALACLEGAPPFTAVYHYDESRTLAISIDGEAGPA